MLEFNETDNLSTMDDKIHHWLEHEGKEHWPRFKEIRDSWKGDVELWEELNVWTYHKLVKEIEDNRVQDEAYFLEVEMDKDMALAAVINIVGMLQVKLQELRGKGMVEGIKEDLVHNIKQQLNSALKWLEDYNKSVDILLDAYGWQ